MTRNTGRRQFLAMTASVLALSACATGGNMLASAVDAVKKLLGLSSRKALAKLGAGGLADVVARGAGLGTVIGGALGDGAAGQVVAVMDKLGLMKGIERKMASAVGGVADQVAPFIVDQVGVLAVNDAMAVVNGPSDAATQLLKAAIASRLQEKLLPEIGSSLTRVGALGELQSALGIAGVSASALNIDGLTMKLTSLAGEAIFSAIAEEERAIRADPASTGDADIIRIFSRRS